MRSSLCMATFVAASLMTSNVNAQEDFSSRFDAVHASFHQKINVMEAVKVSVISYPIIEAVKPKVVMTARMAMELLHKVPNGSPREEVIRASKLFDVDMNFMLAVCEIESSCNPDSHTRGSSYRGLYQLSYEEFNKYGYGKKIFDVRSNAIAAANPSPSRGRHGICSAATASRTNTM